MVNLIANLIMPITLVKVPQTVSELAFLARRTFTSSVSYFSMTVCTPLLHHQIFPSSNSTARIHYSQTRFGGSSNLLMVYAEESVLYRNNFFPSYQILRIQGCRGFRQCAFFLEFEYYTYFVMHSNRACSLA